MDIKINQDGFVELFEKQDQFVFSEYRFPAYVGGIGSGKTLSGCVKAIIKVINGESGVIVSPTYRMLQDSTMKTFVDILECQKLSYNLKISENKITFKNSFVLFRSADAPNRLRGPNLSWAYIDEAAYVRKKIWEILLGRIRIGETSAWITTTPQGFNWIYEAWVENVKLDYHLYHTSSVENPFLSDTYIQDLKNI